MQFSSLLTILDKPKHAQSALESTLYLQQLGAGEAELVSFYWNALFDSSASFDSQQRRRFRHEMAVKTKTWQTQLLASEVSEAHQQLHKLRGKTVWSNDIAGWVADAVKKRSFDLVIKSLHKTKTLLYTPTDWQILRSCTAPVLLTTAKSARARKRKGPVLAALDFKHSDAKHRHMNARVLQTAADYAALTGAPLHVIFAVEISQVLRDLDITNAQVSKQKVLKKLNPLIERTLKSYGVPKSNAHFPVGKAGQVINGRARQLRASVVVVGSAVHRLQQSVGLGNTAERILTKASCDVLVVNP